MRKSKALFFVQYSSLITHHSSLPARFTFSFVCEKDLSPYVELFELALCFGEDFRLGPNFSRDKLSSNDDARRRRQKI
jgi:hypothetical protein